MSLSDPLADMLTRIRNASNAHFDSVEVPASNLKANLAKVLKEEGYIEDYSIKSDGPHSTLCIYLKYGPQKEQVISGLRRISKPSRRRYTKSSKIPLVMSGLGISVLTTSHGIVTDKKARRDNVGGEILFEIW